MFNFLVTSLDITSPRGSLTLPHGRVFQYTDDDVKTRYAPNGLLDEAALMNLPSIITNESSSDPAFPAIARVGRLTKIRRGPKEHHIDYALDADIPPIPNAVLESLAAKLHFVTDKRSFGDFHTNHWAVKDVDLFRVLFTEGIGRIKPTIFKLPEEPANAKLVTVMMPFDAEFNGVFAALQGAVTTAGMQCFRADNIWDNDAIIQDVVKLIVTARVVICDLTGKNANVFYETGIAHTVGQDFILIAQHESDIPFDLRHIRHIRYSSNKQGLKEMAEKVSRRLEALVSR